MDRSWWLLYRTLLFPPWSVEFLVNQMHDNTENTLWEFWQGFNKFKVERGGGIRVMSAFNKIKFPAISVTSNCLDTKNNPPRSHIKAFIAQWQCKHSALTLPPHIVFYFQFVSPFNPQSPCPYPLKWLPILPLRYFLILLKHRQQALRMQRKPQLQATFLRVSQKTRVFAVVVTLPSLGETSWRETDLPTILYA